MRAEKAAFWSEVSYMDIHHSLARRDVNANLHFVGVDAMDKHAVKALAIATHAKWLREDPQHVEDHQERTVHARAAISHAVEVRYRQLDMLAKIADFAEEDHALATTDTEELIREYVRHEFFLHVATELELRGISLSAAMVWTETQCIAKAARQLISDLAAQGEMLTTDQARYRIESALAELRSDRTLRRTAALLYGL